MSESRPASASAAPAHKALWRSKILIAMAAVTLLGVGLWIYAAVTRPEPSAARPSASATSLASGFATGDPAATTPVVTEPEPRLVDDAAPAVARFGGSFIAGFCIAYAFRRILKVAIIVTGVTLIALFALQRAGVVDINTQLVADSLEKGFAWAKGEAGAMKDFILGYLPSAGAGVTGMVMGIRKK